MRKWLKRSAILLVLFTVLLQTGPVGLATDGRITTTPTGYSTAADVEYVIVNGTVVNWGARGEICTFLTTYATDYYIDGYRWEVLSGNNGGTGISDAYSSPLYDTLQSMMQAKHTKLQGYQDTRPYYMYTDCVANDYSLISSFYSGNTVGSTWNGTSYNREHIWPKSKCLYNNKTNDSADIMMLRATITSENSSRGNSAYGESGGYFDPGVSVRGDCARMVLYGYVRWGNTGKMWGTGGVIESLEVLLKWMEEDPVDTWEMGRNDAVQSITGVRNVFVDYPELAWLLFGQEVPEDYTTPSGSTAEKPCTHENTQIRNAREGDCCSYGYSGDTYCTDCGVLLKKGQSDNQLGDHSYGQWMDGGSFFYRYCSICGNTDVMPYNCVHETEEIRNEITATCTADGYTGDRFCAVCGLQISAGETIPATGHLIVELVGYKSATCTEAGYTGNTRCVDCGERLAYGETIPATGHLNTLQEIGRSPTCAEDGYSGDKRCTDCGEVVVPGNVIPATGEHDFGQWVSAQDGAVRSCRICGYTEQKQSEETASTWPMIAIGAAAVIVTAAIAVIQIRKKKK